MNVGKKLHRVHVVTRLNFQTPRSPEAPSTKPQAPKKSQTPNLKISFATKLPLEFGIWSFFGAWGLGLGASQREALVS
jgi:hypothetical protein